jgi:hypothetical protein
MRIAPATIRFEILRVPYLDRFSQRGANGSVDDPIADCQGKALL